MDKSILDEKKQLNKECKELFKRQEVIQEQLLATGKRLSEIEDMLDKEIFGDFPHDPKKFNAKQWQWVLHHGDRGSSYRYKVCTGILQDLGFGAFGYFKEDNQFVLSISGYMFNAEKIKASWKLIGPHKKVVSVKDMGVTAVGKRLTVSGLSEDTTSVLYVEESGQVLLFVDRYDAPKEFESFDKFADWYATCPKSD